VAVLMTVHLLTLLLQPVLMLVHVLMLLLVHVLMLLLVHVLLLLLVHVLMAVLLRLPASFSVRRGPAPAIDGIKYSRKIKR
jgi:hypothetical protein